MIPTHRALLALAAIGLAPGAGAQAPEGLAARALADTSFTWHRDSLDGIRAYFLRGTWAFGRRDSLTRLLPGAIAHARALIDAPPLVGPLDVFFIEDREHMRRLTGVPVTGFAHRAARAIFLVANAGWRPFDRHEVMHIVSAQAWTFNGGRNVWLQEGLSQAADGYCAGYRNADVAAALARTHGWIPLPTLLDRFAEQSDLRAYLQSAAMVEFLLRRVGAAQVRTLWLADVTPATILGGRTLADWEREWRDTLTPAPVDAATLARIEDEGCGVHRGPS